MSDTNATPGDGGAVPEPERCKDCDLTLAPWLRLYCAKCVQFHLSDGQWSAR